MHAPCRSWPKVSYAPLLIATMVLLLAWPQQSRAALLDTPWSGSGSGTATVSADGTAGDPKFDYNVSGYSGAWTFHAVAATARSVPVAWHSTGFYSFFQVSVTLQRFITRGGSDVLVETLVSQGPANCCDPPSGGFDYSGTSTFDLQAGDIYGFRLSGSHNDGTQVLNGSLVLQEVDATPPSVTPQITGTQGMNGFYTGAVTVDWVVSDDGSRISESTGCGEAVVSADTTGTDVTCTATSRGGTTAQKVTIKKDATAPTLDVPAGVTQQAASPGGAAVGYTATASDAIDPAAALACAPASGATFPVGTTQVICTATDAAGNHVTRSFDVTVLAPAAPVATPTPAPAATPSPTPTVKPKPSGAALVYRRARGKGDTRLTRLELRNAGAGLTVKLACAGAGCPKALKGTGKALRTTGAALKLTRFVRSPLRAGTRIVVTISGPGIVTTIKTLTIRKGGKAPRSTTTCLQPGATTASAC